MKRFFFSIVAVVFVFCCNAQITLNNDTYIYNKGASIYSVGKIDLQGANSFFYLRNEGQLLQKTTGDSANKGIGKLSVFQEGTSNQFGYNYWCAPVGNASATVGNENFGITMLHRPTTKRESTAASMLPSSYDGISNPLQIATYWIWKYLASSNYSEWISVGSSPDLMAGEGFTMKGTSGSDSTNVGEATFNNPGNAQRYDFRGKPNDGDITIGVAAPVSATQYNSTLTGNPYPSAINLNYFLLENSGRSVNYSNGSYTTGGPTNVMNGTAYFWEHQKPATSHILVEYIGGYGYYVPNNPNANSPGTYNNATWNTYNSDGSVNVGSTSSTVNYKRMFSPIGQGFMIEGTANGSALMKNIYRVSVKEGSNPAVSNSQFERTNNENQTVENQNWDAIPNVAGVDYTQFSRNEVPQIKIHSIINNLFTKEVTIAFNPFSNDGYEQGFDAKSLDALPNDAFLSVPGESSPFVISTIPFDINKRIPFSLKANGQTLFKINVGRTINFNGSQTIYLFDAATGVYHDIVNGFFQITLPQGLHANRFQITFTNTSLGINSSMEESVFVFQNNDNQLLTIENALMLDIKEVQLFDIAGKKIFEMEKLNSQSSYQFSTAKYSNGVYLVKIATKDNLTKTQKIIISNKQ
jgi:hypothetical protein